MLSRHVPLFLSSTILSCETTTLATFLVPLTESVKFNKSSKVSLGIYLQNWRKVTHNLFRAVDGLDREFEKLFLDLLGREVIVRGDSVHENFSGLERQTLGGNLRNKFINFKLFTLLRDF